MGDSCGGNELESVAACNDHQMDMLIQKIHQVQHLNQWPPVDLSHIIHHDNHNMGLLVGNHWLRSELQRETNVHFNVRNIKHQSS